MKISEPYGVGLVTHVQPDRPIKLSELFKEIQFENFDFLLEIGSIYVDSKRVGQDVEVPPASLVRIHRNPKRHPIKNIDWQSRIIENNENFVIVDKPYGLPTHPTVDNTRENVIYQLGEFLNHELFITHRLDSETTGMILFAKTKQFQTIFNYLMANKYVHKKYKALTTTRPEEKRYIHYIKADSFMPKLVSPEPLEGWRYCELVVEKTVEVILPNGQVGFESQIQLVTGRTHQIRAQMTGSGHPLFGDVLYGDENGDFPLGLRAFHLSFKWPQAKKDFVFEI
jgi:23S rRNA pseudouridine1911/1915/1917 synthase